MDVIEIQTLVDITNTRVIRPNQGSKLAHDQNRNFMTLCQCVEIRSIIMYDSSPESELVDIKGMGFGVEYKGKHRVWTFQFRPDRAGVYVSADGNKIGCLLEDLDSVPIIKNLEETVNIDKAIFNCKDINLKNIIIKSRDGIL